jgi:hypothetical protein
LKSGEKEVNAGVCSFLSKGMPVAIMVLFSLQCFDCDMYSYSGFTLLYENMKNICEGKSQRQSHFGTLIETQVLPLTFYFSGNLK